jgi:tetratricopeptide (TPR) repeat protein
VKALKASWTMACMTLASVCVACGWNPSRPFDRDVPAVREAIRDLDAGDASSATSRLEEYLSTGGCSEGSIGAPDTLKRRPDGTFDLGIALFGVAEKYGHRFGDEDVKEGADENDHAQRHAQIECARRLLEVLEGDALDPALRARARYLEGNLEFLDGEYEDAVQAYDRALLLAPGLVDAGDAIGRDAAWNRAIALRRIDDKKDAGQDASSGDASSPDAGTPDSGRGDGASDTGHDAASPAPEDAGDHDSGPPPPQPDAAPTPPDAEAPPPPSRSEDERMLDQLENAPTMQQEEAKHHKRQARGMVDK